MLLPGCYYAHLAEGQLRMLRAKRPIEQVLADPATPPGVQASLALVDEVLRFAASLGLAVDGQYRSYAPWPGDRVVTALVATEPRRVEPAEFWFPLVGRVPYKGFFALERAEREAAALRARGLATCLVPVPAYSTLGWLDDPVTEPMLRRGDGAFVETLLHELVHATVYVTGDADWNESVATFVGQEAAVRFFREARGDAARAERERQRVADDRAVAAVVGALRARVEALYADPPGDDPAAARAALEAGTREAIRALPLAVLPAAQIAASIPLADPCLALAGTYERDLPVWEARLAALEGDLPRFVASMRAAAGAPDPRAALAGAAAGGG
jgi:predicted aminopeptidase